MMARFSARTAFSYILLAVAGTPLLVAQSITVTPAGASVRLGTVLDFDASVSGISRTSVTWSVNGVAGGNATVGTIGAGGLYTPPTTMNPGSLSISATSVAMPSVSGSTPITLWNPTPQLFTISPLSINTGPFSITITGNNFLSSTTATFGGVPLTVSYISPTQLQASGTTNAAPGTSLALVVTNPNPGSSSSSNTYTVQAGVSITITPGTVTLATGATQSFTAFVYNTVNKSLTWQVNGVAGGNSTVGTIDANGNYTAPANAPNPNVVSVRAQSVQSPSAFSNTATVTIANPAPVISSLTPTAVSYGNFTLTVNGSGFQTGSQVVFGTTTLPTKYVSSTQLTATGTAAPSLGAMMAVTVNNPSPSLASSNVMAVGLQQGNAQMSYATAFHFLEQATWGPKPADVAHLQAVGFAQWFQEQQAAPLSTYTQNPSTMLVTQSDFFNAAMNGTDQLRQRVAFALGQIFCVSAVKDQMPFEMVPYVQLLEADALGGFETLMYDVTLSPSMGRYLDMVNNVKGQGNVLPNENYARELMQLFTTGPSLLNIDGTIQVDGDGNAIPLYTETTIQNFARVFTGWTYPVLQGGKALPSDPPNFNGPMVAWEANHDTGSKTLLNGVVLQAGQSAEADLGAAIDNVFHHPNVGPWFTTLLIKQLTSSNPSAAYVQRMAQVFNDDGTGTRGNLFALVQAILLDPEARECDDPSTWNPTGGHLRAPMLYVPTLLRNLNATTTASNTVSALPTQMSQSPLYPPTVAGYYPPDFTVPGNPSVFGPEFLLLDSSSTLARVNWTYALAYGASGTTGVSFDLSPLMPLASNPAALVQAVSNAFLAGQMTPDMQNAILTALAATPNQAAATVADALYLTTSSALYQVQR